MDTQTQIERLIELAIVQRTELKELVAQLPQLREHLSTEIEKAFDEAEPQLRAELEEWTTKQTADKTAALGVTLEAKIADLAKSLEVSTQARYNAIIAERAENARLAAQAEAKIAEHAASLPSAVKEIVSAELARFPRAGEIDQLRKEFAEPRGLNPRGKWQAGETYNKLDLVTINGDSYTSNIDNNRTRPSRSSADWTLVAARGTGGGGGPTSLSELTTVPSDGDVLIGSGTSWVTSNLTAGAGISITVGPGAITISATDGDITLDDGTAASPSLHFTNDPDTGIYRPTANTLGISTSGVQRMYVDEDGITTVGAGGTFDGSVHAANGNANNPSFSFTSDQDTGFYRNGTNEIGISLGGTQYATLTSTTFSITPNLSTSGNLTVSGTGITLGGNAAVNPLVTINSATNAGGGLLFQAAGVPKALIGLSSYILGGTSTDTIIYSNGNSILFYPSGASGGSITSSGATFTGNLTVSGGTATITGSAPALALKRSSDNSFVGYIDATTTGTLRLFSGVGGSNALAASFPQNGNLILKSDGVDSGNGKLQLADHSTSAGGIGFGPVTSLYASSVSGCLELAAASGSTGGFKLYNTTNMRGQFVYAGTDVYIDASTLTGQLIFRTNGSTTALTLDSSQNATFAGTATFGKGGGNTTFSANGTTAESGIFTQANTGFVFFSDNATATKGIKVDVNNGGLTVLSGGLTTATAGGSAGTWKLGVYSATAPSATGFVTIDIGGTTYKLLAST